MTARENHRSARADTVVDPDPDAAAERVDDGIEEGALITVFGRCTVEYDGRASSTLGPGDRHVTLKPDGSALVHTDEGQQPVNWQPPGCDHSVAVTDGTLVVTPSGRVPTRRWTWPSRRWHTPPPST